MVYTYGVDSSGLELTSDVVCKGLIGYTKRRRIDRRVSNRREKQSRNPKMCENNNLNELKINVENIVGTEYLSRNLSAKFQVLMAVTVNIVILLISCSG
jgi:hypothetical protein